MESRNKHSTCAVSACDSPNNIVYHHFPKEPIRRHIWEVACKRVGPLSKDPKMCEKHFEENSYERDLKNELLGLPLKRKLKPDAVPSLFLEEGVKNEVSANQKDEPLPKKIRKEIIDSIFTAQNSSRDVEHFEYKLNPFHTRFRNSPVAPILKTKRISELQICTEKTRDACTQTLNHRFLANKDTMTREDPLLKENKALKKKNDQLKQLLKDLQSENRLLSSKAYFQERMKEELEKRFTKAQSKLITSGRKFGKWNKEDIINGLVLHSLSSKAYRYIQSNNVLPVPSYSTLKRWTQQFYAGPGIQFDLIQIVSEQIKAKEILNGNLTVLSFAEMKIEEVKVKKEEVEISEFSEEPRDDTPKKSMQIIFVRGLTSPWQQAIYFDFDSIITKKLLFDIILELENSDIHVLGLVSELSPKIMRLWSELDLNTNKTYFSNPVDGDKLIYYFADVPQLLKQLRNSFIDDGFQLEDGSVVEVKSVEELLESDNKDIQLAHKLTFEHLNIAGAERQRLRPATELLSCTTARALRLLESPSIQKVANFIELIDQWFDVMNSSREWTVKPMSCAYGIHLEEQRQVLFSMIGLAQNMRHIKRNDSSITNISTLKQYQKGIIMSTKSLMALYDDLNKEPKMINLLTSRLSLECCENFFTLLSSDGNTSSPLSNAGEAMDRFRDSVKASLDKMIAESTTPP